MKEKREDKLIHLLRYCYQWGRDKGANRSEKNFNDFLETSTFKKMSEELLTDISDEEIEHAAYEYTLYTSDWEIKSASFEEGAKWYRSQINKK